MTGYRFQIKSGAFFAIVVCVGITIAPCSSSGGVAGLIPQDGVWVMSQAVGVVGFGSHLVFLTKEQYATLDQYLVDFQARLHTTTSKEQAVVLFKEAVVEINTYGLLPRGMSVMQAQRLIVDWFQNAKKHPWIRIEDRGKDSRRDHSSVHPKLKNAFCVLSAVATKIPDYDPNPVILPFSLLLLFGLLPAFLASLLGNQELANSLAELGLRVWNTNPLRLFNFVMIIGYEVDFRSIGLKGIVNEKISEGVVFRGYSGLLLFPFNDKTYFLGTAIDVVSSQ